MMRVIIRFRQAIAFIQSRFFGKVLGKQNPDPRYFGDEDAYVCVWAKAVLKVFSKSVFAVWKDAGR